MFYSSEILNIKSNPRLGIVWLAATLGPKSNAKRLGRKDLTSISVPETCAFLAAPPEPLSLRLSANLMIGVSRVYGQQCHYHMVDVRGLCAKLTHLATPSNPDSIDLPNHEKKGTDITMKKIDCISAVNVLPGDPLNFPDLDIANLLLTENHRASLSSAASSTMEIGRKSLLGTPFSVSSSSNAGNNSLQGSDFTTALGNSDFGDLNDHTSSDFNDNNEPFNHLRPQQNGNLSSSSMDFQVPDELATRQQRQRNRNRKLKNALMDQEIMLEKDQLFIEESEMLQFSLVPVLQETTMNPNEEALKLLNCPDELVLFDFVLYDKRQLNFALPQKQRHKQIEASNNSFNEINDDLAGFDGREIEEFRGGSVASTPSNSLILPWSHFSSSSASSSSKQILSSVLNTPSRRFADNSSSSPMTAFNDLKLLSSSSSQETFQHDANPTLFQDEFMSTSNLSKETFDFYYFLQDSTESISGKSALIHFSKVLNKTSTGRAVAARAFHHLLELKTSALIDVKQTRPFADIQIILQ